MNFENQKGSNEDLPIPVQAHLPSTEVRGRVPDLDDEIDLGPGHRQPADAARRVEEFRLYLVALSGELEPAASGHQLHRAQGLDGNVPLQ